MSREHGNPSSGCTQAPVRAGSLEAQGGGRTCLWDLSDLRTQVSVVCTVAVALGLWSLGVCGIPAPCLPREPREALLFQTSSRSAGKPRAVTGPALSASGFGSGCLHLHAAGRPS